MKTLTFITVTLIIPLLAVADEPVGPAYAAQKAAELKELQRQNAALRDATPALAPPKVEERAPQPPPLTGPAYAAARQRWLWEIQRRNARYWGTAPVGPAYAAYTQQIKANQRFWNGTWPNNVYWYSRPTYRIHGPYLNTPAFRGLSDPYIWGSQANSFWRY